MAERPSPHIRIQMLREGCVHVSVTGELDMHSSKELERRISSVIREGDDLDLDFGSVGYVDSGGIRVLFRLARTISPGDMTIRNADPSVRKILDISGIGRLENIQLDPL